MPKKFPGIRCVNCGCRLDPGERCDCEKITAEKRTAEQMERTRRIVEHNLRLMEEANNKAWNEFWYA